MGPALIAPVANGQTVTVDESSSVAVTLTADDADPLTYKVGNPTHGVLLGAPPMLTYSPDSGYFGTDSFTFVANDGLVDSNVATVDITIQALDKIAPTTAITITPDLPTGLNGWYTSTVTMTVTATDGDDAKASGVDETRCVLDPAVAPLAFGELPAGCAYAGAGAAVMTDGMHIAYAASRDVRGNGELPVNKGFQIDLTPPTISANGVPPANGAGWNNSDVIVQFACDDAASGVANCAAEQVVATEGVSQTITGTAGDNAGNRASTTLNVNLDKTAPTATAAAAPIPNLNGWNNVERDGHVQWDRHAVRPRQLHDAGSAEWRRRGPVGQWHMHRCGGQRQHPSHGRQYQHRQDCPHGNRHGIASTECRRMEQCRCDGDFQRDRHPIRHRRLHGAGGVEQRRRGPIGQRHMYRFGGQCQRSGHGQQSQRQQDAADGDL